MMTFSFQCKTPAPVTSYACVNTRNISAEKELEDEWEYKQCKALLVIELNHTYLVSNVV